MMHAILSTQADEINRLHSIALENAERAIDSAKLAGLLLLEVKSKLPHGEFLPWLECNGAVSARQAQRYMRAALGKPIPVRAIIKNDTVSDLPSWLPTNGKVALTFLNGHKFADMDAAYLLVQEVSHAKGYFHAVFMDGPIANWLKRGIRADHVEEAIINWLPGCHLRTKTINEFDWQYFDYGQDSMKVYVELLNSMGQE